MQAMGDETSVFAELAKELRNIEHCVEFFADLAKEDNDFVPSKINANRDLKAMAT